MNTVFCTIGRTTRSRMAKGRCRASLGKPCRLPAIPPRRTAWAVQIRDVPLARTVVHPTSQLGSLTLWSAVSAQTAFRFSVMPETPLSSPCGSLWPGAHSGLTPPRDMACEAQEPGGPPPRSTLRPSTTLTPPPVAHRAMNKAAIADDRRSPSIHHPPVRRCRKYTKPRPLVAPPLSIDPARASPRLCPCTTPRIH